MRRKAKKYQPFKLTRITIVIQTAYAEEKYRNCCVIFFSLLKCNAKYIENVHGRNDIHLIWFCTGGVLYNILSRKHNAF
jgi:hypothetical protein